MVASTVLLIWKNEILVTKKLLSGKQGYLHFQTCSLSYFGHLLAWRTCFGFSPKILLPFQFLRKLSSRLILPKYFGHLLAWRTYFGFSPKILLPFQFLRKLSSRFILPKYFQVASIISQVYTNNYLEKINL